MNSRRIQYFEEGFKNLFKPNTNLLVNKNGVACVYVPHTRRENSTKLGTHDPH